MNQTLTCTDVHARLSAFVDGELTPDERRLFVRHFDGCARCRLLARDLERLRAAARELGPIDPPAHVWLEVAGQIHLGAPKYTAPLPVVAAKRPPLRQYLSVAAALIVLAGGIWMADRFGGTPEPGPSTEPAQTADLAAASVDSITADLAAALTHYDSAMTQLQQLASSGESALDPQVATAIQENLTIIDQAIAASRTALEQDPQSEPARATLVDALRQKMLMLQTTVELMNEMERARNGARAGPGNGRKS
jgi:anti-sigma factor RsiW